jgi:hypothetical protein
MQIKKAVITGDIVNSSRIGEPAKLIRSLDFLLKEIDDHGHLLPGFRQIFKGDSFQVVCEPQQAVRTTILLRAGLIGKVYRNVSPLVRDDVLSESLDARISVAINTVESMTEDLSRSFGNAFTLSGKRLQKISGESLRILISTGDPDRDPHFELICRLLDVVISDWTTGAAEAIYRSLLTGETQKEVAAWLQLSQPSVQSRLSTAHAHEIRQVIGYFSDQFGTLGASEQTDQTQ